MAFSFGTAAPAPAGGGFSFGGAATNPAPAPGGFGFGSGAPAAPSAQQPSSLFGSAPLAAPAGGGLFGSSTPAPSGFGGFGGPAPAPGSSLFGTTPAPSSSFGSAAPAAPFGASSSVGFGSAAPASFGIPQAAAAPMGNAAPTVSSLTTYSDLPPQMKQAIDAIHEQMLRHRRTMMQVETMGPALLRDVKPGDVAAGTILPLKDQLFDLERNLGTLNDKIQKCGREAMVLKAKFEQTTVQSVTYGVWPIEALAARRGVQLSIVETTEGKSPTVQEELRKQLDMQTVYVDRIEKIPSPFMWLQLADMEHRLAELTHMIQSLKQQLEMTKIINNIGVASVVQQQTEFLRRIDYVVAQVHGSMEGLRTRYRLWERGPNILDKAAAEEELKRRKNSEQVKIAYLKGQQATQTSAPPAGTPATGGLFGSNPTSGGLFGNTPGPAPGGGGLFGSTPAPAGASLFGSAPAPVGGGLFGSTPAPAPAAGGSLFGSASAPTPAAGGGSLFGGAPAPTPAAGGGGLFGSAPAPAPTGGGGLIGAPDAGGFGSFASNFTSTPKAKKTSSSRRRK